MDKTCQNCKLSLPLSAYNRDKTRVDGYKYVCRGCTQTASKVYTKSHKQQIKLKSDAWYANNKDRRKAVVKAWRANQRGWERTTIETNIQFRLKKLIRSRLKSAVHRRGIDKAGSAVRDLGCTVKFLKQYLESKFQPGMTWDNWGNGYYKWNIDHIKRLADFDLSNRNQFLVACHYTNLQPLWWIENMKKQ
jgi:hypothetical protein